jgi:DNA polymerase-1
VSGKAQQKTLLLVDGSSYLYRAFHALPELKSPRGEPTGAIRGVLSMLRRLAEDHKAQARACVFDARGPTFREAEYAEYKANRPSMPEDLAAQIEPLKEACAALGWPVLAVEGVEADDVIATLAAHATRDGLTPHDGTRLSELFALSEKMDVANRHFQITRPSLENVFLHLTGKTLRDA